MKLEDIRRSMLDFFHGEGTYDLRQKIAELGNEDLAKQAFARDFSHIGLENTVLIHGVVYQVTDDVLRDTGIRRVMNAGFRVSIETFERDGEVIDENVYYHGSSIW